VPVKLREVSLAVASLLITLCMAELILQKVPFFSRRSGVYKPRPSPQTVSDTLTLFEPNFEGRHISRDFDVAVRSNSLGFREREIDPVELARERPIFVTGDSYFLGHGVERRERITEQLGASLSDTPWAVPIVNYSFFGIGTRHYLEILERFGERLHPRLVVIGFFVANDFLDDQRYLRKQAAVKAGRSTNPDEKSEAPDLRTRLKTSSLVNLVKFSLWRFEWFRSFFNQAEVGNDRLELYCDEAGDYSEHLFSTTFGVVDEIQTWAALNQAELLFVIVPDHLQLLDPSAFGDCDIERPQREIRKHFTDAGINFIDLLPELRTDGDPASLYFREDKHWTARGHQVASEIVSKHLRTRPAAATEVVVVD